MYVFQVKKQFFLLRFFSLLENIISNIIYYLTRHFITEHPVYDNTCKNDK